MKLQPSARIALASCASVGILFSAPAAWAQAPMDLKPSVRVEDTTGALGNTSELKDSISQLADDHQVNLFVVTIDQFESPSNSEQWAQKFGSMNNLGSNDVLLVIATDDRQAYFAPGGNGLLSTSDVNEIYQNNIFPQLKKSDYSAAASAAVQGIDEKLSGGTASSTEGSGSVGGVATSVGVLGGVAALAAGGAWMVSRRRKSANSNSAPGQFNRPQAQQPLVPIPQLRKEAGNMLVQVDDAIVHSEQEVEFARLQYGESEVAPFVAAIESAKAHMQRSFQLQKQLDDTIPDTEEEQRAWLGEIISRTKDAYRALEEQKQNFTNLRQLEQNAPQILQALEGRFSETEQLFPTAEQSLEKIRSLYADSAVTPVADNVQEAHKRLDFARTSMSQAQSHMDSNRSEAVLEIRAAEEAVGQAKGLLESVTHRELELAKTKESLDSAILVAERDVAQARELSKFANTGELAGAAAGVSAVIDQIRAESAAPKSDPLALSRKLTEVRSDLDRALNNVREIQDRQRAAGDTLQHTLVSAQAQVSSASEYVWARRGGVSAEARTKLREAERNLAEAQSLQRTDPMEALNYANNAIRLANDAQNLAQVDVDSFTRNNMGYGNRGGVDLGSAMLGGILMGSLFGGNHSGGGMFGGGGGFGGGFGGGGDFGGGDFGGGAGGNF